MTQVEPVMSKAKRGTRILTWHAPSGQWRRMLNGKLYYLGKGRGISDRASYNRAVQAWKQVLASAALLQEPRGRSPLPINDEPALAAGEEPRSETLCEVVERFLRAKEVEARAGKISHRRTEVLRSGLSHLVQMFGEIPIRTLGAKEVDGFRIRLFDLKAKGQLRSSTANLYFGNFKGFLRWAWSNESIPSLPRNISAPLFGDTQRDAKPKQYFAPNEIQQIYRHSLDFHHKRVTAGKADEERDLMTAALLLGLNCGFTQSDIADLKVREVNLASRTPRIVRRRSKTQVQSNHLLWRKTKEVLKGWVEGKSPEDPVFQRSDGAPVAGRTPETGSYDIVGDRFARFMKSLFGEGETRRFRELRRTSANWCAQRKSQSVAEWFLAHTDKHVSAAYIERPQRILDVMLAYLEVDFGFEEELNRVVVRRKRSK